MTTEKLYLQGLLPVRFRILCVTLRPLSVAHMMILSAQKNAFVSDGERSVGDLLHGISVCSERFPKCLHRAVRGRSAWSLWFTGLRVMLNSGLSALNFQKFLTERVRAFDAYLSFGCKHPEVIGGGGRLPGAGLFHRVKIFLQAEMHMSIDDAMNHPAGAALCDYFVYQELYDRSKVMNEDELQASVEMSEAEEKLAAKLAEMIQSGQLNEHLESGEKWMAI